MRVLFVDDDPAILQAHRRRLRRSLTVETATNGPDALRLVSIADENGDPYAICVSDLRMPGMDGARLLELVREASPDTVRILLTGHADVETAISAVNRAGVFRFLLKPCQPEDLSAALEAAAAQHALVTAERELLEQTLRGSIRAFLEALALAHPRAFAHSVRTTQIVQDLTNSLEPEHAWEFEIAAMLADIGAVTLPADVVDKLYGGTLLSAEEQAMVDRLPTVVDRLVSPIPRLEHVREILRWRDQRYDARPSGPGSAFGPAGDEIPLASRVLKVARDFEELDSGGMSPADSVEILRRRTGAYDPVVLQTLARIFHAEERPRVLAEVTLQELADVPDGTRVARDLLTEGGTLLLSRGHELTPSTVERLRNWSAMSPIGSILLSMPVSASIDDALPSYGDRTTTPTGRAR
jgi:response regulator RpfG family c-di-GMP phosphodiesterase